MRKAPGSIPDKLRTEVIFYGLWDEMCDRWETLVEDNGLSASSVQPLIVREYTAKTRKKNIRNGSKKKAAAKPRLEQPRRVVSGEVVDMSKPKQEAEPQPQAEVKTDAPLGSQDISNREAIEWVFENIDNKAVKKTKSPSGGAWGLLQWARASRDDFYKLWARLFLNKAELEQKTAADDDDQVDLIDRVLALAESIE